jgi:hypothetical protein
MSTHYLADGRCVPEAFADLNAKTHAKVARVMREFAGGELHSGSKHGPTVTSRAQAIAIALSEARKAGARIPKKAR